jgi:hypothetical protein
LAAFSFRRDERIGIDEADMMEPSSRMLFGRKAVS